MVLAPLIIQSSRVGGRGRDGMHDASTSMPRVRDAI